MTSFGDIKIAAKNITDYISRMTDDTTSACSVRHLYKRGYRCDAENDAFGFNIFAHGFHLAQDIKFWLRLELDAYCVHKPPEVIAKLDVISQELEKKIMKVVSKMPTKTKERVESRDGPVAPKKPKLSA